MSCAPWLKYQKVPVIGHLITSTPSPIQIQNLVFYNHP